MSEEDTPRRPTDGELQILRVLWESGPSTVRHVHDRLLGERRVGYTTVLKLLQVMFSKGLVQRDASSRTHVYSAAETQGQTQRFLIRDLIDRAFDGSARKLVLQALSDESATDEELAEIRELLQRLEKKGTP